MQRLVALVIPYCLASGAWAGAGLPRHTLDLQVYGGPAHGRAGAMRLRITLAGDVREAERGVRVGDLLLCSPAACYRARTAGQVTVANTADGKAALVADVWIADTGGCYPRVDILPRLALRKPAVLTVPAVRSACSAPAAILPVGPAPHGAASRVPEAATARQQARAVLSSTGVVEPDRFGH